MSQFNEETEDPCFCEDMSHYFVVTENNEQNLMEGTVVPEGAIEINHEFFDQHNTLYFEEPEFNDDIIYTCTSTVEMHLMILKGYIFKGVATFSTELPF